MHKGHFVKGTVEGTGAALNVPLGFIPEHVTLENTDAVTRLDWWNDLDDGDGVYTTAAGARALVGAGGISPYDGNASDGAGFTLGTHAINGAGESITYIAWSSDS